MTVGALRVNGAVAAVFVVLVLTFLVLTIAEFAGAANLARIGGWLGIITALLAWYASAAVIINTTWQRAVLPVWAHR